MKLQVYRFNKGKDSTNGILFDITKEKRFMCYTLEDEEREVKVFGETCIPSIEYTLGFRKEGKFHEKYAFRFADIHIGMIEIQNVPNFKHILIHCGNTDEDTAGCLLVGDTQANNTIKKNGLIGKSTQAYFRIYKEIASALVSGEECTISFTDHG